MSLSCTWSPPCCLPPFGAFCRTVPLLPRDARECRGADRWVSLPKGAPLNCGRGRCFASDRHRRSGDPRLIENAVSRRPQGCLTGMRVVLGCAHLGHDDPCCPVGRHGGGGSEWRTRLRPYWPAGFRVAQWPPGGGSMARRCRAPGPRPQPVAIAADGLTRNDAPALSVTTGPQETPP
jgi:hypothetical protein